MSVYSGVQSSALGVGVSVAQAVCQLSVIEGVATSGETGLDAAMGNCSARDIVDHDSGTSPSTGVVGAVGGHSWAGVEVGVVQS